MKTITPSVQFWEKAFQKADTFCTFCPEQRPLDYTKEADDFLISSIDHLVPISLGGSFHPDNVVPACIVCNFFKRDLIPHEFGQWTEVRDDGNRYVRAAHLREYIDIMRLIIASEKNRRIAEFKFFKDFVQSPGMMET